MTPPAHSSALFFDNFSTGDLSKTGGGFNWFNATSAVVINTADVGLPANPSNSQRVVRFSYNAAGGGLQAWAELSFNLVPDNAAQGYETLFLRYYLYYPSGSEGGTVGPQWYNTNGSNNKLLRLYDTYGRISNTIALGASTRGNATASGGASVGDETAFFETGGPTFYASPGDFGVRSPLCTAARRGSWTKVEFEVRSPTITPTGWNAGNGVLRMWINDVVAMETTTASQSPANTPMRSGYLMGYQNGTMDNANGRVYLADFAVSSTERV